ncbi:E3 ubiquitin- ligase RHF2A-like [Olea europaea subsp. europaea]|uniref:E3 ubiquitin- ligase RHF2A-like n=1 Tax=Olea europaea subsp. europaea TaxID=158383 RepID=A0A8S0S2P3_OLEEU|nr:E3 ubiquitin- ligase RHF2A-like [Olea europaea subsp. europaea]
MARSGNINLFELFLQLPVSAGDSELEERIIQHLAAAAAMGRARQLARREGERSRSSTRTHPRFLVFSSNPNPTSATSPAQRGGPGPFPTAMIASSNSPFITLGEDSAQLITSQFSSQADHITTTASGSGAVTNQLGTSSSNRRSPAQTSPNSQDIAGPSDFQSFSESLKSRLNALSVRYRESITKSTRGWKERLFARNSSTPTPDPGTEVHREVNPGTATVPRMMDYLEIAEDSRTDVAAVSNNLDDNLTPDTTELEIVEMGGNSPLTEVETQPPCAAGSASN